MIRFLLFLLLVALLVWIVIFWPREVYNQTAAIRVPLTWSVLADDKALAAFTRCWPPFCKQIRSSVEVRVQPAFIGKEDAWLLRTQQTMKIMTTGTPTVATAGNFKCIESEDQTASACISRGTGLIGAFRGAPSDLATFHAIIQSAHRF